MSVGNGHARVISVATVDRSLRACVACLTGYVRVDVRIGHVRVVSTRGQPLTGALGRRARS